MRTRPTVLLVEPDEGQRSTLTLWLTPYFSVTAVADLREAWMHLENSDPSWNLLILDLVTYPEGDGYAVIQALRNNAHFDGMHITGLTPQSNLTEKVRASHLGIDFLFIRPLTEATFPVRMRLLARIDRRYVRRRLAS